MTREWRGGNLWAEGQGMRCARFQSDAHRAPRLLGVCDKRGGRATITSGWMPTWWRRASSRLITSDCRRASAHDRLKAHDTKSVSWLPAFPGPVFRPRAADGQGVPREAGLYSPQPGGAGPGRAARGLGMVERARFRRKHDHAPSGGEPDSRGPDYVAER